MNTQTIFMTGATSGLGLEVASHLAATGAKVVVTARSAEKIIALQEYYKTHHPTGQGKIEHIECDLSSFESIVAACSEFKSKYDRLDTIINNAGVWNFTFKESKNQIEEIWHVNFLAPLLINHLLVDLLAQSSDAKIIYTASGLHQGDINFNDLEFRKGFSNFKAYRQSKLAVILMCRLLAQKLSPNIGIYSQHPGLVSTELGRSGGYFANLFFRLFGLSIEKGAQTLIFLAKEPKNNLISGEYYTRNSVKQITKESYDMTVAEKLFDVSKMYLSKYITQPSLIFGKK